MKPSMITAIALIVTNFTMYAQKPDLPQKVREAFAQKVPDAKDVEWEYDSEDQHWEVEYESVEDEFTSAFDENGRWVETTREIGYSQLPEPVKARLEEEYPDYEVEEVELLETPDGTFYEIEVESEDGDMEVEVELIISPDGRVVSRDEDMDDDEDDDD